MASPYSLDTRRRYYGYDAAYRATHRVHQLAYRVAHREALRAYNAAYVAAHRDEHAHRAASRRARKLGNGGSHTLQEWRDKCALLGRVCVYCGEAKPLTKDHKVPLLRGGTDDISNIVPACRNCNARKRTRTAKEFIV